MIIKLKNNQIKQVKYVNIKHDEFLSYVTYRTNHILQGEKERQTNIQKTTVPLPMHQ